MWVRGGGTRRSLRSRIPTNCRRSSPLLYERLADGRTLVTGYWSIGWPQLSEENRNALHTFVGDLRQDVVVVATELAASGVPAYPGVAFDLSLLTQLMLCAYEGQSPEDVVDNLGMTPPYVIQARRSGAVHVARKIPSVEDSAQALRRLRRSQQLDDRSEVVRETGGRPTGKTAETAALREHLEKVLVQYPKLTAGAIVRDWKRNIDGSAGRRLRELMGRKTGEVPPPTRTLERLIGEFRKQSRQ